MFSLVLFCLLARKCNTRALLQSRLNILFLRQALGDQNTTQNLQKITGNSYFNFLKGPVNFSSEKLCVDDMSLHY